MTNLREAAQVALDALEHGLPIIEDFGGKEQLQLQHKAIAVLYEALRAALAQPIKPDYSKAGFGQPEQEPVAWMYDWYDETEDIDGVPIGGIVHDWISKDYDEAHSPTMGCHNIRPLYTAPPQCKFIGLTDEEIEIMGNKVANENLIGLVPNFRVRFARAIEAKLKEKNT